jgi:hypothetical protein
VRNRVEPWPCWVGALRRGTTGHSRAVEAHWMDNWAGIIVRRECWDYTAMQSSPKMEIPPKTPKI